jgi:hypothetical protein
MGCVANETGEILRFSWAYSLILSCILVTTFINNSVKDENVEEHAKYFERSEERFSS